MLKKPFHIGKRVTKTHLVLILVLITLLFTFYLFQSSVAMRDKQSQEDDVVDVGKKLEEVEEGLVENVIQRDPPSKAHIFYYGWYRNKEHDGAYNHWNHQILAHWTPSVNQRFKDIGKSCNVENKEIGANYYPEIGLYSSIDPKTIRYHMLQIKQTCKITVLILSYWANRGDENISKEQANIEEEYLRSVFQIAEQLGLYIIFHLEPYKGRNAKSTINDIHSVIDTFGSSPAFYRTSKKSLSLSEDSQELPLFYIYDSYLTPASEWSQTIRSELRGTKYDSLLLGLYTNKQSELLITGSGFDGFYTYFGAVGFTYGSTPTNWPAMTRFAEANHLLFVPSVAPGYLDEKIRPWNSENTRKRQHGKYYDEMFQQAISTKAPVVAVTSYNEWHEGTQIEPAIPMTYKASNGQMVAYEDYSPEQPDFYLKRTAYWVEKMA